MKQITINIPDHKYQFFMELIKSLKFVKVEEPEAIPQWQQDEVSKRLDLIEKGEMKTRSWKKAKKDIFKK
jgi:hypothetical protein